LSPEDIKIAEHELIRLGVTLNALKIYYDAHYGQYKETKLASELGTIQDVNTRLETEGLDAVLKDADKITGTARGQIETQPNNSPTIESEVDTQNMENVSNQQDTSPTLQSQYDIQDMENGSNSQSEPTVSGREKLDGNASNLNISTEKQMASDKASFSEKNNNIGKIIDDYYRNLLVSKSTIPEPEEPIVVQSNNNSQNDIGTETEISEVYDREFLKFFLKSGKLNDIIG